MINSLEELLCSLGNLLGTTKVPRGVWRQGCLSSAGNSTMHLSGPHCPHVPRGADDISSCLPRSAPRRWGRRGRKETARTKTPRKAPVRANSARGEQAEREGRTDQRSLARSKTHSATGRRERHPRQPYSLPHDSQSEAHPCWRLEHRAGRSPHCGLPAAAPLPPNPAAPPAPRP